MRTKLTGKITLQEDIEIIVGNKLFNTFVVHIPKPLRTYYSRFTTVEKPNSILFLTKNSISNEQVLRATTKINADNNLRLSAAKTRMKIGNSTYTGFRVKGIDRFSKVQEIQKLFQNEGFLFDRERRLKSPVNALIRVSKFFNLEKLSSGIFKSHEIEDSYILEVPKPVSWEKFRTITFDIKSRISTSNYDVVNGVIYTNETVVDVIRVIKPNIKIEELKEIQELYWEKMTDELFVNSLI